MRKSISIGAAILSGLSLTSSWVAGAAEEGVAAADTFVALKFEGSCGGDNNRLYLSNSHTFKTISVVARWRAAGGKDLQEQFFLTPNSQREIGCAAESEIVEAKFADF